MKVVHENHLRLMIDSVEDGTSGTNLLALARASHIDGLIMLEPRTGDQQLLALARDRFPVVLIGSLPGVELCSIDIDNREAARLVVEHLLSLGHRRIGCITNAPLQFTAAAARLAGYRDALKSHGIPFNKALVRFGGFSPESGRSAMKSMLGQHALPSAVFVASDEVALGALRAVVEAGLRVPRDISLFGFDNIIDSLYATPPLSTVSFPVEEHGRRSAQMLFELMNGRISPPHHETTPFDLVVRESSAGRRAGAAVQRQLASSLSWKDKQSEEVYV